MSAPAPRRPLWLVGLAPGWLAWPSRRLLAGWLAGGVAAAAAAAAWVATQGVALERERFDTDARIAHRVLSQRAVAHEAILATLALLQPGEVDGAAAPAPEQRLPAVYPQVLAVARRERGATWPTPAWQAAEVQSAREHRAVLAQADLAAGRFTLLRAASPASFALQLDLARVVPWAEWPLPADGPARVELRAAGQTYVVQPGRVSASGELVRLAATKRLAAQSQPFDVVVTRSLAWRDLPWADMARWAAAVLALAAVLGAGHAAWWRQHAARRRAEARLRHDQVARLNALGELAAGMAHELNQPLTALLANTQAASRLLADDPPDLTTARHAMQQAVQQARRASDVLGRLRETVQRPAATPPPARAADRAAAPASAPPRSLAEAVRQSIDLLEPECTSRGIRPTLQVQADAPLDADTVALQQIVDNLLMNALQALEQVPAGERTLTVEVDATPEAASVVVRDSGPGIDPGALPHLFEPFYTTKEQGLGLGLTLCETLAAGLGGVVSAANRAGRGAEFRLLLPRTPLATTRRPEA